MKCSCLRVTWQPRGPLLENLTVGVQSEHPGAFRRVCMIIKYKCLNRTFSHDVTSAILVFQTNEKVAMLVFQTSPVGLLFQ